MILKYKSKQAFSLVELITVIIIIGILSSVAIPAYTDYRNKAKVSNAVSFVRELSKVVMTEFSLNGEFPESVTYVGVTFKDNTEQWLDGRNNIGGVTYHRSITSAAAGALPSAGIYFSVMGLSGLSGDIYKTPTAGDMFSKGSEVRWFSNQNYTQSCGTNKAENFVPMDLLIAPCKCMETDIIADCEIKSG